MDKFKNNDDLKVLMDLRSTNLKPNGNILKSNDFVWMSEELVDADHYGKAKANVDLSPLVPFSMMLVVSTLIFIVIIFRKWPYLVTGITAGCLTSASIYILLLTLKDRKLIYE